MSQDCRLLPKRAVAKGFGVSIRTVDRWHNDETLGFPKPIVINRRCYFDQDSIDRFKVECVRRSASAGVAAVDSHQAAA